MRIYSPASFIVLLEASAWSVAGKRPKLERELIVAIITA